jgi:hypothetical protein
VGEYPGSDWWNARASLGGEAQVQSRAPGEQYHDFIRPSFLPGQLCVAQVDKPCAPRKVADLVVQLVSDDGHDLTGQVIAVDDPRSGLPLPRP